MARARKAAVDFSQEVFDRICELIADGKSVRSACVGKGMPDRRTFNRWCGASPELQEQYDRACKEREDAIFDDVLHISDTIKDPARARVMADNRKWVLACMNRKKYGNKVGVDGGEDGSPVVVEIVRFGEKSGDA